jgi:hypothetical protein
MHLRRILIPALVIAIGAAASVHSARAATAAALSAVYGQEPGGWDVPPQELNEIQRQGFHDGIQGAHRDFENHRQPDVNNRDEYRHPHLPPEQREAYRDGFRRGYNVAMSHLMGGGPGMAPPPPRGDWDTVPHEFGDIQQRGFHDGIIGARRDFDNHRQPNVENRDEFRHPPVPPELRDAYREGFRRGYNRAMAHLMGRPWDY